MSDEEQDELDEQDERGEADLEILSKAVTQLMEHFDSVQIVVTRQDGKYTRRVNRGQGNHYARIGSVREWLMEQDCMQEDED